ncbi:MAG: hemL, partial [Myxococcales bacterium]|nr:hemL [Myxococcales bacterium]
YVAENPGSQRLAERARAVCPGGVSQISRDYQPFAPYYARAAGTRKWSVDGQEIVDFCMGHGALIFGHNHPEVFGAIQTQLACGTHYTGPSEPEVALAELICEMVPSAQRVRFTGTGSEAVDLALRVARAATGRDVHVRFEGHYHGWHDQELAALKPPYDAPASSGLPRAAGAGRVVLPPGDLAALERTLDERTDLACVILEPAGGGHGTLPTTKKWVTAVRELTSRRGVILIFDEMVSGFRLAPGGYQGWSGIVPDLTTLGKALFGGMPGGALAGRADLMDLMKAGSPSFVAHFGSWNAFPVACAAGAATLRMLRDGRVHDHINTYSAKLRAGFNEVIAKRGVAARVYGSGSHVHFYLKPWPFGAGDDVPIGGHVKLAGDPLLRVLRLALFSEGLDFDFANNISAIHGDEEAERAVSGFDRAIASMLDDRLLTTAG